MMTFRQYTLIGKRKSKMVKDIESKIKELYDNAEAQMPYFKKNLYEQAFNKYYGSCLPLFDEIKEEILGKDEEFIENYINEFSDLFVSVFKKEYDAISKKGKKSSYVTNHNTPLVVYVFPSILNYKESFCKPCVDAIVSKWNDAFKEMKIGYGTYEDIKGGFRTKLCYITTAVCESLNKDDDCMELNLLRDYRDNILSKEPEGRALIEEYYDVAPTIVKRINRQDNSSIIYRRLYNDYILSCLSSIENKDFTGCKETYTLMVTELKKRYAY